ncbi:cupredoxin family protein [Vibrio fluvialis]|uniref:copper-resistant cuproprotein CopI n=1 Tax=Vibrio fluvialis TaxID=676 RepID=UPI001C9C71F4|nr:cupredoxin family protein [Vibrio fluvialis]HDM8035527.1 cupredoxin family protein [Vibrio fluvialis clinical-1]EKO3411786.1 cupredoxin family protein [Vibrio fluvialis]EKO3521269.1 cupredoxin family protein [Vibrio fluvialis]EKO3525234.1 cupredoxin family protein [Vibrio fluvialis]EKO3531501.1 cupredoxin family protein [Vibrio fluvialis]
MKITVLALALSLTSPLALADMTHGDSQQSGMEHSMMSSDKMPQQGMDHSGMMNMGEMSDVGMSATGSKPTKVVHVLLSDDMKITFKKEVDIQPNDVVQFVIMNTGKIDHEFSIGSAKEQLTHREMMRSMNGQHMHDSGSTVTVQSGKAKQLMWHFQGDNNVEFACNIPGHAEAGMVKKVTL